MRKYIGIIFFVVIGLIAVRLIGQMGIRLLSGPPIQSRSSRDGYQRVISFLPSVTETLYALGVEDKIVGVTRYCKFPPQAQQKPNIGGLMDISYETIYNLEPDLLILSTTADEQWTILNKMGFNLLEVETRSVGGILESIMIIGQALGQEKEAEALTAAVKERIEYVNEKTKNLSRPKVLITYLRPYDEGGIRDVYIAGNNTYFNDLLEMAGGENAYQGPGLITSPIISVEGILDMDPDVIVEVTSRLNESFLSPEELLDDWDAVPQLKAYKNNRIYVLDQPYVGIPGPRLGQTLEDMARVVHPEADWD